MNPKRNFWLILTLFLLVSFGCQTIGSWLSFSPQAPHTASATIPFAPVSKTATPIYSSTPPINTPSPISPSPTPTVLVTPSAEQMAIFEELWQIVRDEYLYPDYNGADWEAIGVEYRQR
ncbi:MAG: hypothetical protein N3D16_11750, partial [Anaerolineales bacterium]|nr:hypothetical protein [Anaerolineales bacterium]